MPPRPRCPHCYSYQVRRLIPWWEPWLRLVLVLTLIGLPAAIRMGRREPQRGDRMQCDTCVCQFFAGMVRAF